MAPVQVEAKAVVARDNVRADHKKARVAVPGAAEREGYKVADVFVVVVAIAIAVHVVHVLFFVVKKCL